ncbi:hypothetical protein CCS01_30460 [Rhodopila globiformis]|uniref:Uncharacterized protein n=1 Tax=Rhodopila globiformis TaxID=1071 RepID=A0A2S6MVA1_RHOGL|nr:hypothetical protein CCS01_30460 [Rhodopila globiformis]
MERYGSVTRAILFLVSWPALDRAARLAIARAGELDGNLYDSVTQAAEALAGRYPLAATLLLRAMIDDTLAQNRAGRFGHAARHLRTCASLATAVVRTPQDRNAAEDLLRDLEALRARCEAQARSLVTPMGNEMFYRYQESMIKDAQAMLAVLLQRSGAGRDP